MQLQKLFEPGKMGQLVTRNRLVMAPLSLGYTQYPYNFTPQYIDALEERAKGGVGLIVTAHVKAETTIDPYPINMMFSSLDREYLMRCFTQLTESVHRHGAKIAVQLSAGTGRYADLPMAEKWPAAPSAVSLLRHPKLLTRELRLGEVAGLVEAYGQAAERAKRAGFDAIMVHCSSSYLIGQFLSPAWNKRADRYGGSLENRMRFMVECVESARSKVGSDFTLMARLTTDPLSEGGTTIEETIQIARRLEELGIAAFQLSPASYESLDWLIPPVYYPSGCKVPYVQSVKHTVNVPVIIDGRIDSPDFAESLLQEGKGDFIALGRPLLADPEWPRKAKEGRSQDIRSCIYCNECINRTFGSKYSMCAVNPALGREKERWNWPASRGKKVLVVGGGPAGMQAALVAASRGHKVTLYEKSDKLGGNLRAASAPQFKTPMRPIIDWLARETAKAGVEVQLGREVTRDIVDNEKPDAVIVATGSVPHMLNVPGVAGDNVVAAADVLLGKAQVRDKVVVVGAGMVGCETALYLSQAAKQVTMIEMLPDIACDAGPIEKLGLRRLLAESTVKWFTDMRLEEVTGEGVMVTDKEGRGCLLPAETVVLATGMRANDALFKALEGNVPEVHVIGDALQPRRVFDAIHEGEAVGGLV